jgi:hypothetical protein
VFDSLYITDDYTTEDVPIELIDRGDFVETLPYRDICQRAGERPAEMICGSDELLVSRPRDLIRSSYRNDLACASDPSGSMKRPKNMFC